MKYKIGEKIKIKERSEMGWYHLGCEDLDEEEVTASHDRILTVKEIRDEGYEVFYIVEEMCRMVLQEFINGEAVFAELFARIYEPMVKCSLAEYKEEHYIMDRFDLLQFESAQEMFARRVKEAENRKKKLAKIESLGYCEGYEGPCECKDELWWYKPRTFYQWDKDEDPYNDPNRKLFLCRNCGEALEAYWDDMWGEYYAGLL